MNKEEASILLDKIISQTHVETLYHHEYQPIESFSSEFFLDHSCPRSFLLEVILRGYQVQAVWSFKTRGYGQGYGTGIHDKGPGPLEGYGCGYGYGNGVDMYPIQGQEHLEGQGEGSGEGDKFGSGGGSISVGQGNGIGRGKGSEKIFSDWGKYQGGLYSFQEPTGMKKEPTHTFKEMI